MKLKNKDKIEVWLTLEFKEKVRLKAEKLGVSMADIIKRALEEYVK